MNIEEINKAWAEDCAFDLEDLAVESSRIGKLHQKYYKLYIDERMRLLKLEEEYANLKKIKRNYFAGRMDDKELTARGWEQFPLKLMRDEIQEYIDTDKEIVSVRLRVATATERIDYLKSIIDQIKQRSFNIRNAVEWKKFEGGF